MSVEMHDTRVGLRAIWSGSQTGPAAVGTNKATSVVDPVPIHQILQNAGFASADAEALLVAFDSVCRELGLASDNMPMRNLVALKVVDLAIRGERDPNQVALVVLAELRDTGALGASDAKP